MVHFDYICDACGFTSEEERGVYKCPVCGNQMRAARTGRGGDNTSSVGRYMVTIIAFFITLFIGVLILGPLLGVILALILTFFFYRWAKSRSQNNAVRVGPSFPNPNKTYTCGSCGKNFKGQRANCPHCGIKLKY